MRFAVCLQIAIRPPKAKGRYEILKVHANSVKLDPSVDLWVYAKNLPGASRTLYPSRALGCYQC